jgi:hypothetical protein
MADRPLVFIDYPEFSEKIVELFISDIIRTGELCSAGAQCNARGLAKLAAIMANRGQALDPQKQDQNKPMMSCLELFLIFIKFFNQFNNFNVTVGCSMLKHAALQIIVKGSLAIASLSS